MQHSQFHHQDVLAQQERVAAQLQPRLRLRQQPMIAAANLGSCSKISSVGN
jgi:hypothetical protein